MTWVRHDPDSSDAAWGRPYTVQAAYSGYPVLALTREELSELVTQAQELLDA